LRITPNRGLVLALAGMTLLLAATLLAYRPPAPRGPLASPDVFSAHRSKLILQDLMGSGLPHPIGSAANARLRQVIVDRLTALGYGVELQSGFACNDGACGSPVNIIARLGNVQGAPGVQTAPGAQRAPAQRDVILLAGHYDSVPAGPGATDDGAAVAAMLEIARILAARPPGLHPVVLLFTDGEEAGLLGAQLFVREHPLAQRVAAAVNMEARGTSGPSMMFETGSANAWLMRLYGSSVVRPITNSLYYAVYKQLPNDTDFTVFKRAGYQGFNFAIIGNVGRYHTPRDSVLNADEGSIQHQGDSALAVLSALAGTPDLQAADGESVFFDGFARTLISWPARFTLPAALTLLALVLGESVVLLRRGALRWTGVVWGWLALLGMLGAGVLLSAGLLALLIAAGRVPPIDAGSWVSQPLPMHVAATAAALLAAAGTATVLGRRVGFWGFWVAASLTASLLSVACAVILPGASFIMLIATAAAAVAILPALQQRNVAASGWRSELAALLPLLAGVGLALPSLQFLYAALGSVAWPVTTAVLCLTFSPLLPLLGAAEIAVRRRVIGASALAVVAGGLTALAMPAYSADWPQRINLEYWLDGDTGQAHYLACCNFHRLPPALAAAAPFDAQARPRFAGSANLGFHAVAPTQFLAAPELTLNSPPKAISQMVAHFDLHLRSVRGAPEALIIFPASAGVLRVELETPTGSIPATLAHLPGGSTILDLVGLPAAGVDFGFDAADQRPVSVRLFDQSYGLSVGGSLERSRSEEATSSQEGDLTVVHRTVSLSPAAGR
jgi:Peptidase family M28